MRIKVCIAIFKSKALSRADVVHNKIGIITINEPVDYMAQAVIILMRGKDITRAIGRVGPRNVFARIKIV